MRKKNKVSVTLILILGIVSLSLVLLFLDGREKSIENPVNINKEILANEVVNVKMTKWVEDGVTWKQKYIDLNQQEVNQIRSWLNSVPANRIRDIQDVNPNLSAGIVFELKSNAEVRIQYDKKDIYVTRNDLKADYTQTKYVVEGSELKDFFDKKTYLSD